MENSFLNLTLLYVEDDDIIRENAVEYLSSYFKDVLQAKDGENK
jgi:CheY-like chemotaxis protein